MSLGEVNQIQFEEEDAYLQFKVIFLDIASESNEYEIISNYMAAMKHSE